MSVRRNRRSSSIPKFVPPSLATLHDTPPVGESWVHEIKFDGYRIQALLAHGGARLLTRKGLDWTSKFPNVADAVARLPARTALVDGEIVVEDGNGISSFSALQAALKFDKRDGFLYCVFDILYLDGHDLTELPLVKRKSKVRELIKRKSRALRFSEHFEVDGVRVLRQACKAGLEGIVSKRRDAPYRSGRSDNFIKVKCSNAQEFVVGGYSPSTSLPKAIGALAIGFYYRGRLKYAGRIGTGFTHTVARDLWRRLSPWEVPRSPFNGVPRNLRRRASVRWVEPKLVIEANFRGWTADDLVRQAAFKGIREDKPPREVTREAL